MELGMVGLGRMGANLVRRLMRDGHRCVVYRHEPRRWWPNWLPRAQLARSSYEPTWSSKMTGPRHIWVMVPAGHVTESVVTGLAEVLEPGDAIIDGGNSSYHDDLRHAENLRSKGLHFVDCGTSGGVWGLERGYCLMIGGDDEVVNRLAPIWDTHCSWGGCRRAHPWPLRRGAPEERGWLHCGPNGAGHFVKMVHNGIEYGADGGLCGGLEHPQARRRRVEAARC